MSGRPAAGGGRWVEVDPARLSRWLAGFAERHGTAAAEPFPYGLRLTSPDGTVAELYPPPGAPVPTDLDDLVEQATRPRRIGLLLARQGGVAVGIGYGGALEVSKVDSRYVQGRTAAGGWSQQRFARRRENQAKAAAGEAAEIVVRLLLPATSDLAALVTGGDRRAVDAVLADPRLAPLVALRSPRFLTVGDPKHATLEAAVTQARAVRIRLVDPATGPALR
jgi:VLRF1 release factor-like protein